MNKNLEKLIAAAGLCALLATWAATIAPAATHEAPARDAYESAYDADAPVAQYRAVEEFLE